MSLSTHVLDTTLGRPAAGVLVSLARRDNAGWTLLLEAETDADGRVKSLLPADFPGAEKHTIFRLRFASALYFAAIGQASLYPYIDIVFQYEGATHYHIPLLLTANGYTTYRGS